MARSNVSIPEMLPLARFVSRLFGLLNLRPHPFSRKYNEKYGTTNSGVRYVLNGITEPKDTTLQGLARALAEELKASEPILAEDAVRTVLSTLDKTLREFDLYFGDEDEDVRSVLQIGKKDTLSNVIYKAMMRLKTTKTIGAFAADAGLTTRDISAAEFSEMFDRVLSRLPACEQLQLIAMINARTAKAASDLATELKSAASNPMRKLIAAIEEDMTRLGADTPKKYAAELFKRLHSPDHPDLKFFQSGIEMVMACTLPEIDSPLFSVTMSYLAGRLKDGRYKGDVSAMLSELLAGKSASDQAKESRE